MSVTVYIASVKCVRVSVQCECISVSLTVYSAIVRCVSDSLQWGCEVCL